MTNQEALNILGLSQMPRFTADIEQAFRARNQALNASLQFPKQGRTRQQVMSDLVRIQKARDTLLTQISGSSALSSLKPFSATARAQMPFSHPKQSAQSQSPIPHSSPQTTWGSRAPISQTSPKWVSHIFHMVKKSMEVAVTIWSILRFIFRLLATTAVAIFQIIVWAYNHPRMTCAGCVMAFMMAITLFYLIQTLPGITSSDTDQVVNAIATEKTIRILPSISTEGDVQQSITHTVFGVDVPETYCTIQILTFPCSDIYINTKYLGESPSPMVYTVEIPMTIHFECRAKEGRSFSFTEEFTEPGRYRLKANIHLKTYHLEKNEP